MAQLDGLVESGNTVIVVEHDTCHYAELSPAPCVTT
jgi:excinuclease UvrABC ATPase subunit